MNPEPMPKQPARSRQIKTEMARVFSEMDAKTCRAFIASLAPRTAVNPLFSLLLHPVPLVKWRAVQGFGIVAERMAGEDLEGARTILRRMMWQLNDESGGIGWGCPEGMGEIVAVHAGLAVEFHQVLISYIREDGNFLEYGPLRRGALWGVGRAAETRADLMQKATEPLLGFCQSDDAEECALAARALGQLSASSALSLLESLRADAREVVLFLEGTLRPRRVGEVAREAVERVRRASAENHA